MSHACYLLANITFYHNIIANFNLPNLPQNLFYPFFTPSSPLGKQKYPSEYLPNPVGAQNFVPLHLSNSFYRVHSFSKTQKTPSTIQKMPRKDLRTAFLDLRRERKDLRTGFLGLRRGFSDLRRATKNLLTGFLDLRRGFSGLRRGFHWENEPFGVIGTSGMMFHIKVRFPKYLLICGKLHPPKNKIL